MAITIALLVTAFPSAKGANPTGPSILMVHAPILINGDGDFTPANGVTGGTGTAADPYVISGWDINASGASGTYSGIEIQYTRASFIVRNVSVHSGGASHGGIGLVGVGGGKFENIILTNNSIGMDISQSSWNVVVRGASFSRNTLGLGIDLSWGITLQGNSFDSGGVFILGSNATNFDSHTITPDNRVAGKPILYYSHCSGLNLDGTSLAQLIVAGCTSVRAAHLRLANVTYAVIMSSVNGAKVENDTISDVGTAIYLWSTHGANISRNYFRNLSSPILADSSSNVTVDGNVALNFGGGLLFSGGRDLMVKDNTLSGALYGNALDVSYYTNAVILGNNFSYNRGDGMWISAVWNLTVRGNALWNNSRNIELDGVTHGVLLGNTIARGQWGVTLSYSYDLLIHHNNFLYNQGQASSFLSSNVWWDNGYPSGGNYWSDYSGTDYCSGYDQNTCTGPDGIGDTPRLVSGIQDRYPLMTRYLYANRPPVAAFTLLPSAGRSSTTFTADASASNDFEDLATSLQVRWVWGDGTNTSWSTARTSQHRYQTPGSYTISLEVRDLEGLVGQTTSKALVDDMPPSATLTASGTHGTVGWYTSPATVTLEGSDDISGVAMISYRLDGGTPQTYGGPIILADGVHTLDYWAVDAAGNVGTVNSSTLKVDTAGPVLGNLGPTGTVATSQVTITWRASDSPAGLDHYEISVDGGALEPVGLQTSRTLQLGDGEHSVRIRAMDAAGNPTEGTVTFRVDTNVFSSTGPYYGLPLYVPIVLGVGLVVYLLLRRRRR